MLMYLLVSAAMAQSIPAGVEAVPGEYLIKLKNSRSVQAIQSKVSGKMSFKGQVSKSGVMHLKLENSQDFQTLSKDPDVEFIEPNYVLSTPNVDKSNQQILSEDDVGAMASTTFYQNYAPVQVVNSWAQQSAFSLTNRPIVAVVDTGVQINHAVFTQSEAIWTNSAEIPGNGIDDDNNGYRDDINGWNFHGNTASPNDDEGHGTHVAGIVVGTGLDIFSSPRDKSKVQIMPLKFLSSTGSGRTSDAVRAIYYAVDNGATVINCSWGGGSYSRALIDALTYAYDNEVLVVTAAGNNASNNDSSPMYPAAYDVPANLSVASTTDGDNLSSFSNYGASSVHVGAPGSYIYSTYIGGTYTILSGTSMATPFVAGIAALAWREAPQLTGYQIKQLVMSSVNPKATLTNKVFTQGRVNAYNLMLLSKSSMSTLASQPSYSPNYSAADLASEAASGGGGGCGLVRALGSGSGGAGGSGAAGAVAVLFVCLLPLAVWMTFKLKHPELRRKYERFNVSSDIKVNLGGREITGHMKTLSMGGLSFSAEDMIEKGSLVTMKISNPSGDGEIEVQGRIVWSAEQKAYGVQFQNASQTMLDRITSWTKSLGRNAA